MSQEMTMCCRFSQVQPATCLLADGVWLEVIEHQVLYASDCVAAHYICKNTEEDSRPLS